MVEEIRKLCEGGAREVVLSGIDLGNYGRDLAPRAELGELLRRILDETAVERLRVSSVEPMDVTEDLIAIFAASERMARHFHMPMQSGSDRILAAMHRWYRAEHYARRAELAREWLPDAAIGADVIAGFPGETEEDHRATLSLIERLPLTYLHVFSFSSRPGTPAAELRNQVPEQVIARRARELRALGEKKKAAFQTAQAGRTMRVLTLNRSGEDASGPWTRALSSNYLDVRVSGEWPANQFLDVRITGVTDGHLTGRARIDLHTRKIKIFQHREHRGHSETGFSLCEEFDPAMTSFHWLLLCVHCAFSAQFHDSKMTCARAVLPSCVMVRAIFFTPRLSAMARVAPDNFSVGLPLGSRTTSISTQRTPRAQPVPRAFIAASLAAKRPANRSARLRCFSQ